jgi:hypothetical protein
VPDRATINVAGCIVNEGASITGQDQDREPGTVTDNDGVQIKGKPDQIVVMRTASEDNFPGFENLQPPITVVSSTGITCRGTGSAQDGGASDAQYPNQYDDSDDLAAGDIIINVPDKPLPATGGAPAGLALAGCVLILLGASLLGAVWRGRD